MDIETALAAARSEGGWIEGAPGDIPGPCVIEWHMRASKDAPLTLLRCAGDEWRTNKNGDGAVIVHSPSGDYKTWIDRDYIRRWKRIEATA
jgi:hypothetical protein